MTVMRSWPWLIIGTLVGAFIGYQMIPWFQHGWESEAWYWYRPVYGALIGFFSGLFLDLLLNLWRK